MTAPDPRLDALAAGVRRTRRHARRLSIELTARALSIPIRTADLGPLLVAATYGDNVILNRSGRWTAGRLRFAFAHEVAHVLIRRGRMPWVDLSTEEWWADRFAHELILPRGWVASASVCELRLFDDPAERMTVAVHLARLRRVPKLMRIGEAVACAKCGDMLFFERCECAPYRRDGLLRLTLPKFRFPRVPTPDQLPLFDLARV